MMTKEILKISEANDRENGGLIKILHLNIDGLRNQIETLTHLLETLTPSAIILTNHSLNKEG